MNRLELKKYIAETYGIEPDCPWIKNPNFEVYRHSNNKKWFALIMDITRYRIGYHRCGKSKVRSVIIRLGARGIRNFSRISYEQGKLDYGSVGRQRVGRSN